MAATFSDFFCLCCRRSKQRDLEEPDENTHLIRPDPDSDIPPTTSYVVDHQTLQDRLGSIVRAKEGQMVNVNANLPFNLHNKTLHDQLEPSSSRSLRSRSAHAVMGGFSESVSEILHEPRSRLQSCSPTRGRDLSPSLETSRSNTSLHPGDASYLPPEADLEGSSRRPILNMRLVRGAGGYGVGDSFRTRKGRDVPRGRVGRFAEDSGSDAPESSGVEDGAAHAQAVSADSESLTRASEDGRRGRSPDATLGSPGENANTPLATAFAVRDVGKITCSWGD